MGKEFLEMQQEAAKRIREMQSRAMPAEQEKKPAKQKKSKRSALSFLNAVDIKKLCEEGDGLILLVILLLICEDGTDELLVLALIYILM